MKKKNIVLSLLGLSLAFTACGEDHDHEDEDVGVEICEHHTEGPGRDVMDASNVSEEHVRYDASLPMGETTFVFDADEATEFVIALDYSAETMLEVSQGGELLTLESVELSDFDCELSAAFHVDLAVGSAEFTFTNMNDSDVDLSFVIEENGGHDDEEHDHDDEE